MLHIFLLILKILGLLVLGVLLLVLIALVVISVSPFRYRIELSFSDSLDSICGQINLHWIMHLFNVQIFWRNGEMGWRARAAWKQFGDALGDSGNTKGTSPAGKMQSASPAGNETDGIKGNQSERAGEKRAGKKTSGAGEPQKNPFHMRFHVLTEKIKRTYHELYGKIKVLRKKKRLLEAFLKSEIHKNAFFRLLKEARRFLISLHPHRLEAKLNFGFEDPANTGYVLAGISMAFPLIGQNVEICPDFHHKVLKGSVCAEGTFRILSALMAAWNLFWDHNMRITYRHIRKFKL